MTSPASATTPTSASFHSRPDQRRQNPTLRAGLLLRFLPIIPCLPHFSVNNAPGRRPRPVSATTPTLASYQSRPAQRRQNPTLRAGLLLRFLPIIPCLPHFSGNNAQPRMGATTVGLAAASLHNARIARTLQD